MISEVNFNMYFQSHSYSHTLGMKRRPSGSHKDPLVSSTSTSDLVVALWVAPDYKWVSFSEFVVGAWPILTGRKSGVCNRPFHP